jgi:hypothetical protein
MESEGGRMSIIKIKSLVDEVVINVVPFFGDCGTGHVLHVTTQLIGGLRFKTWNFGECEWGEETCEDE